jgi:uncharacterized protein YukJ
MASHPGVQNYGVLRGAVIKAFNQTDHYHLTVSAGHGGQFDVAINITSKVGNGTDALVRYFVDHDFQPPARQQLLALNTGLSPVARQPGGIAFDFTLQQSQVAPGDMMILDPGASVAENDLHNELQDLIRRARLGADAGAEVFVFGSRYPQGDGIHEVHMNQGNPPNPSQFFKENGHWQDGALVFRFPGRDDIPETLVAVYIAFHTQDWNTLANGDPDPNRPPVFAGPQ